MHPAISGGIVEPVEKEIMVYEGQMLELVCVRRFSLHQPIIWAFSGEEDDDFVNINDETLASYSRQVSMARTHEEKNKKKETADVEGLVENIDDKEIGQKNQKINAHAPKQGQVKTEDSTNPAPFTIPAPYTTFAFQQTSLKRPTFITNKTLSPKQIKKIKKNRLRYQKAQIEKQRLKEQLRLLKEAQEGILKQQELLKEQQQKQKEELEMMKKLKLQQNSSKKRHIGMDHSTSGCLTSHSYDCFQAPAAQYWQSGKKISFELRDKQRSKKTITDLKDKPSRNKNKRNTLDSPLTTSHQRNFTVSLMSEGLSIRSTLRKGSAELTDKGLYRCNGPDLPSDLVSVFVEKGGCFQNPVSF